MQLPSSALFLESWSGGRRSRAQRRALPLYTPCMCSRLFPLHHHAMPQMPAHCPLPARPLPRAHPPTGAPRRCAPALPPAHLPALTTRGWAHSRGLASQLTSLRKLNVSLNGLDTLPKDLVRALPCPPGSQFTGQGFHLTPYMTRCAYPPSICNIP